MGIKRHAGVRRGQQGGAGYACVMTSGWPLMVETAVLAKTVRSYQTLGSANCFQHHWSSLKFSVNVMVMGLAVCMRTGRRRAGR